jgi:hypothetical protein
VAIPHDGGLALIGDAEAAISAGFTPAAAMVRRAESNCAAQI